MKINALRTSVMITKYLTFNVTVPRLDNTDIPLARVSDATLTRPLRRAVQMRKRGV